jgi:hypothetical protein
VGLIFFAFCHWLDEQAFKASIHFCMGRHKQILSTHPKTFICENRHGSQAVPQEKTQQND